MEELLHGSTRLPNLQYLPRHHKTVSWTAKHAHHYQSLSHHAQDKPSMHRKTMTMYHIKPQNDTIYCFLQRIKASKLADQGRKYKIQLSPAEKSPWSVGFQGGQASAHAHYARMLINWNSGGGCGRRTRNRCTTWSGLTRIAEHIPNPHDALWGVIALTGVVSSGETPTLVPSPDPNLLWGETVCWTKSNFV